MEKEKLIDKILSKIQKLHYWDSKWIHKFNNMINISPSGKRMNWNQYSHELRKRQIAMANQIINLVISEMNQ